MTAVADLDSSRLDWLAAEFERHRAHLRAVGYRMLGSLTEAEDAVQEAWLRLTRGTREAIDDLRGWLTDVRRGSASTCSAPRASRRET